MSTSRRGFLRGLVGVGAGAAATGLPGCAPDISPAPVANADKDSEGRVYLEVSRYPDLSRDGGAITLRVTDEQPVLVMHPGGNQYAVVSSLCTHSGCPLGFQDGEAICPCHLSRFALDGTVTHPPARAPLTAFAASFDEETGLLLIDFSAGDEGFPAVVNEKIFFPFSDFPELKTPGGRVQGTPRGYGKLIFVFALDGGTYAAVDSICTHAKCPVRYREPQDDLFCECHESRFTKVGEVREGPALQTGNLKQFTVTSDDSGVTVTVVR
ncbi:ubiquinol-cytochrome c reductase iron-sulfur subunit [Archangium sp.]|uniref:QcrA and Rieske domain-containing protein n=1 Tax=Archangium sp. TaxID=1872627 RepID=UPI002D3207D4|nr:Rieske 2Fe-2S domain-containing protein [Archangium sp.]HYO53668.1 Rieske 2Fe-2S domain-containing protein [Archangium sp.]